MTEFIKRLITSFFLGGIFWLSFVYMPPIFFSFILLAILMVIIRFEWHHFFSAHQLSHWFMMPLYPILPFVLLIVMNQDPLYHDLLLELFLIVASADTGAYIIGSAFGKHKIAPSISPNKSWEGFAGGYVFATTALLFLILYEQNRIVPLWIMLGFTLIICTLALLGDLFESWLKRRAGIKNSGNILPGHGGFLDRFDGIMFAVIFFYIFKDKLVLLFG